MPLSKQLSSFILFNAFIFLRWFLSSLSKRSDTQGNVMAGWDEAALCRRFGGWGVSFSDRSSLLPLLQWKEILWETPRGFRSRDIWESERELEGRFLPVGFSDVRNLPYSTAVAYKHFWLWVHNKKYVYIGNQHPPTYKLMYKSFTSSICSYAEGTLIFLVSSFVFVAVLVQCQLIGG